MQQLTETTFSYHQIVFLSRMIKQGANIQHVERVLKRTFGRHNKELLYVANNSTDFLKAFSLNITK